MAVHINGKIGIRVHKVRDLISIDPPLRLLLTDLP